MQGVSMVFNRKRAIEFGVRRAQKETGGGGDASPVNEVACVRI